MLITGYDVNMERTDLHYEVIMWDQNLGWGWGRDKKRGRGEDVTKRPPKTSPGHRKPEKEQLLLLVCWYAFTNS
jgi:hypothetical protein